MSQSLSKVYVHLTFSTKNRSPFIDDTIKTDLWEYLGGICRDLECNPIRVGGHDDHVHNANAHRALPCANVLRNLAHIDFQCNPFKIKHL